MPPADRQSQGRRGTRHLAPPHPRPGLRAKADLSASDDNSPLIALTSGEPAGIGPDICLALAAEPVAARLAVLGDPDLMMARARLLGSRVRIEPIARLADTPPHRPGQLALLPVPLVRTATPGRLDPANAPAVVAMLEQAGRACLDGEADAMVTAPVQKSTINAAGIPFSGHTEFLAALTGTERVVMLLTGGELRVALATTHLPLAAVPAAITVDSLTATIRILDRELRDRFGIAGPRITVLGLNPHAGEDGVLGDEEIRTIRPVVAALRHEGLRLTGPVAADSAFTPAALAACDAVVAMYHDQGLGPLKARHFGGIVNLTLGLPIIRSSVDHGTALGLAGSGRAEHSSLAAAVTMAIALALAARRKDPPRGKETA